MEDLTIWKVRYYAPHMSLLLSPHSFILRLAINLSLAEIPMRHPELCWLGA